MWITPLTEQCLKLWYFNFHVRLMLKETHSISQCDTRNSLDGTYLINADVCGILQRHLW